MSDIRKLKSLKPYLSSSFDTARSWLKVDNYWFFIITESESSILEIHAIEGDSHRWGRWYCGRLRGLAHDSISSYVSGSDGVVANLAEGEYSVLWLEVEPNAGQLKVCATGSEATCWLDLLDDGLSVEVELQVWAVLVNNIYGSRGWLA